MCLCVYETKLFISKGHTITLKDKMGLNVAITLHMVHYRLGARP